jgi:MerR family transcriptional regulator, light-induced transcriptional regulator
MRPLTLSISAVERDTGLSKDTLRVWERRYGFPTPERDAIGERAYSLDQVEKLRIVKRLMDGGHRPGRVVPMPVEDLQQLSDNTVDAPRHAPSASAPDLRVLLELLRSNQIDGLRRHLQQLSMALGLQRFVCEVIIPFNTLVGDSWMRGQLEIHEEHAYSEVLQIVLRGALANLPLSVALDRPRVLLTTFPNEPHALGLLMAETLFALQGAKSTSLGAQTPVWNMVLAAAAYKSDILALGFTGCMNPNQVVEGLTELRAKLPESVEIWVGGSSPVLQRRPVEGVIALGALSDITDQVERWRHGARD